MTDILRSDGTMHRIYRATISDVNRAKRSIVATINTDAVDGFRTVVDPNGMDQSEYTKAVLWEHGASAQRGNLPVGSNSWIQPVHDRGRTFIRAETRFYAKGSKGDDFTENLFEMYYDGELRGFSVNGTPDMKRCSRPTKEELKAHPHWEEAGTIFRSWKLKEYSACFDPVNKECITLEEARCIIRATERGIVLPDELIRAAKSVESAPQAPMDLPPLGGRPYAEYRSEVLRKVQGLFDPAKLEADLKMHADYQRGVV
jgi:hypothetical protein